MPGGFRLGGYCCSPTKGQFTGRRSVLGVVQGQVPEVKLTEQCIKVTEKVLKHLYNSLNNYE